MAIFKSTAFSKLRNSFGNLTTCRFKGQNIVKEKVTEVFNPRTIAQQMQRLRMKTLIGMCDVFAPVIDVGFSQCDVKMTPDNLFVQLNQKAVAVSEDLEVTIAYDQVVVSKGSRRLPAVTVTLDAEGNQLVFTHEAEKLERRSADDDRLYAAVLERGLQKLRLFPLNERKDTAAVNVPLPEGWGEMNLEVYVFIRSKDGRQSSNSKYLKV